jgi:hypothetical protein
LRIENFGLRRFDAPARPLCALIAFAVKQKRHINAVRCMVVACGDQSPITNRPRTATVTKYTVADDCVVAARDDPTKIRMFNAPARPLCALIAFGVKQKRHINAIGCMVVACGDQSPITNHQSPITNHRSPIDPVRRP